MEILKYNITYDRSKKNKNEYKNIELHKYLFYPISSLATLVLVFMLKFNKANLLERC